MTEEVVITLSEKDLIKALSRQYDLQPDKTSIKFGHIKNITPSGGPELSRPDEFIIVTSDRQKQSEVKTYNQLDR